MNYELKPAIKPGELLDKTTTKFECADLHNSIVARDTDGIIKIIAKYTNEQRMQLVETYRSDFSRDPIEDLKKDYHGDFDDLITGLLMWPMEYVSKQINKAIGRTGMNARIVIEMLTPCTNAEINEVKRFYKLHFNRELADQLHSESVGTMRQLFFQIMNNCRRENANTSVDAANQRAVELMAIVEVSPERLENYLVCMLTKESEPLLRGVFYEFEKMNQDTSLEKIVDTKLSGELKTCIKTMIEMTRYLPRFYANRINKAIDSWVTDTATIMRIIVSRREIDLENIKLEYKALFNHDMVRDIKTATSGDIKRCLLALMGKK